MFFVLHAFDKAGALEKRLANYEAHKLSSPTPRRMVSRSSCLARLLPTTAHR
jgi:hypothetical protein